ncbi:MAG TPA: hypothetical protein VH933_05810 [Aestuariivirgaceae bacterium]|jgi:hypothetical protein
MPRHKQSVSQDRAEKSGRPPWPDQVTESQYDLPEEMESADRAATETVAHRVSERGAQAARSVRAAGERITTTGSAAAERVSALAGVARDVSKSVATRVESFTQRRPLSALAGALLAGLVLGLSRRRRRE